MSVTYHPPQLRSQALSGSSPRTMPSTFRLMDLPQEIRDQIYAHMLVAGVIRITSIRKVDLRRIKKVAGGTVSARAQHLLSLRSWRPSCSNDKADNFLQPLCACGLCQSPAEYRIPGDRRNGVIAGHCIVRQGDPRPMLNIIFANHKIKDEALPVLYKQNTFEFRSARQYRDNKRITDLETCILFLNNIPASNLSLIRPIHLHLGCIDIGSHLYKTILLHEWHTICRKLSRETSLRSLTIFIRGEYDIVADRHALDRPKDWTDELLLLRNLSSLKASHIRVTSFRERSESLQFIKELEAKMFGPQAHTNVQTLCTSRLHRDGEYPGRLEHVVGSIVNVDGSQSPIHRGPLLSQFEMAFGDLKM